MKWSGFENSWAEKYSFKRRHTSVKPYNSMLLDRENEKVQTLRGMGIPQKIVVPLNPHQILRRNGNTRTVQGT